MGIEAGALRHAAALVVFMVTASSCGAGEDDRTVRLPEPRLDGQVSVEEALARRRSVRSFKGRELSLEEISQLCWSAQGVTEERMGFRAAPSAGATYPLELYVFTRDGVFRYEPGAHTLERSQDRDRRDDLARAALDQRFVAEAPVVFVLTAFYARTARRYGTRAGRYVHMEAGHAAQNVHLQAVALGLGSVPVGAFRDEEVSRILGLDDDESPLYVIPVGEPARGRRR